MNTMMYFNCEQEISGVRIQGWVTVKRGFVWTEECSMAQSLSVGWDMTVIAVWTVLLERVEWLFWETGYSEVTGNNMHKVSSDTPAV